MKFIHLLTAASALMPVAAELPVHIEPFPHIPKNAQVIGYNYGDEIPIECIKRNMETGEHLFDDNKNIIYAPFPKCFDTDAPLTLKYGVDENVNCSIDLGHEFFHIFQLYIHEDVPFSCRIPYAKTITPVKRAKNENGEAEDDDEADTKVETLYTTFTLNVRGTVQESHLDIDPLLNVAMVANVSDGTVSSSIAFSSGSKVQRFIIGDYLPLNFNVRWYKGPVLPSASSAIFASRAVFFYSAVSALLSAVVCFGIFYYHLLPKKVKQELLRGVLPTGSSMGVMGKRD